MTLRQPEAELKLPGLGVVRFRSLTVAEQHQAADAPDTAARAAVMVVCGAVRPAMTAAAAAAAPPAAVRQLADAIAHLSGLPPLEDDRG